MLSATIVLLLLARLFSADRFLPGSMIAILGGVGATWAACWQLSTIYASGQDFSETFFTGLLVQDLFSVYFRIFLSLFLVLTIALTVLTGIPDNEDGPDFYSLLLGATIGMMIMASANNLLMLFIGVEMASVPSYAMVGFLKGRKPSSEAALKYVVYGAGAAGVMLYGISLIAGVLGTGDMTLFSERLRLVAEGGVGGTGRSGSPCRGPGGDAGAGGTGVQTVAGAVSLLVSGCVRRSVRRSRRLSVGRVKGGCVWPAGAILRIAVR